MCETCEGRKGSWPKGYLHNAALDWMWCADCGGTGIERRQAMTEFRDFFDVDNDEHLKAWAEMEASGSWPKGFLPNPIYFGTRWFSDTLNKMANKWLENRLTRKYLDEITLTPLNEIMASKPDFKTKKCAECGVEVRHYN